MSMKDQEFEVTKEMILQVHDVHFCTYTQQRDGRNDGFLAPIDQVNRRYPLALGGYLVMPVAVSLLVAEPEIGSPSLTQAFKERRFAVSIMAPRSEKLSPAPA